jgi:hypothetical protein
VNSNEVTEFGKRCMQPANERMQAVVRPGQYIAIPAADLNLKPANDRIHRELSR